MDNPWKDFTFACSQNVLKMDEGFCQEYDEFIQNKNSLHQEDNCLHLELFPEPFMGNPDSKIYLLGANPGVGSKNDIEPYILNPKCINLWHENLSHGEFLYLQNPDECLSIQDTTCRYYKGGFDWWHQHICEDFRNNIFNIEFFPYHTKKTDGLKKFLDKKGNNFVCGSNKYADYLINNAIKDNKIIIITRLEKYWLKRIPKLSSYNNLYVLLDHQKAYVGNGNIVNYSQFCYLKQHAIHDLLNQL